MMNYIRKILYILTDANKMLLPITALFVISSTLEAVGIGLVAPFLKIAGDPDIIHKNLFLSHIYEISGIENETHFIAIIGIAVVIIFLTKSCLYLASKYCIQWFTFNQKRLLINRLLHNYLNADYVFHLERNIANITKNMMIETNLIMLNGVRSLMEIAANFVVVLCLLILLTLTDSSLLLLTLGALLPALTGIYLMRNKLKRWGKIQSESQNEMIKIINHSLGGIKETRIVGCESYFENQIENEGARYSRAATLFFGSQFIPRITIEALLIFILISFVLFSLYFQDENITSITSTLAVFAVASLRLIPASSTITQSINQLHNADHALNTVYLDLKAAEINNRKLGGKSQNKHWEVGLAPKSVKQESFKNEFHSGIQLQNLTYSYPGSSAKAIKNINLKISKGESIGLIGKSGSGKTTLVDIILGLLIPENGDILADQKSVLGDIRSWQNLIGYIPQSIFLTDDTVARNIAFGVPDHLINLDRLNKAIKAAQLDELIQQLPQGIKTSVGDRGIRLSGGQRQRIGIARALYHEREILILDEATSALDNETELLVTEAIQSLAGKKTMIVIAHRLSTLKHCNSIYVLEDGKIIRSGSYDEIVVKEEVA